MTVQAIRIAPILATSPTLAEEMRLCGLRAALSARKVADEWVLHDPRLWLGIAFHRLVERVRFGLGREGIELAWDEEVEKLAQAALSHPLDRRYSVPQNWPGYQLARIRSIRSAEEMLNKRSKGPTRLPQTGKPPSIERRLSARGDELIGRPDEFSSKRVTDYKSSLPQEGTPSYDPTIARHKRQLSIYAAIIAEVEGAWVGEGLIQTGAGQSLSFRLDPVECNREADEAVELLHNWRSRFAESGPLALAHAGPDQCCDCRFQSICPAFWAEVKAGRMQIKSARVAAVGELKTVQPGNDPDINTLSFGLLASSSDRTVGSGIVIRKSIHGSAFLDAVGEQVRVSNAILRSDGRLSADYATVLLAENRVPSIVATVEAETEPAGESG